MLVDVKKDLNKKDQRDFLCARIKKISIVIKNVNRSEDTLMHQAERPSNYFSNAFTHYQAE